MFSDDNEDSTHDASSTAAVKQADVRPSAESSLQGNGASVVEAEDATRASALPREPQVPTDRPANTIDVAGAAANFTEAPSAKDDPPHEESGNRNAVEATTTTTECACANAETAGAEEQHTAVPYDDTSVFRYLAQQEVKRESLDVTATDANAGNIVIAPEGEAAPTTQVIGVERSDELVAAPVSAPADDAETLSAVALIGTNNDAAGMSSPLAFPEESDVAAAAASPCDVTTEQDSAAPDVVASPAQPSLIPTTTTAAANADSQAWVVDFGAGKAVPRRKMTKREKNAIAESRLRSRVSPVIAATKAHANAGKDARSTDLGVDSEGNTVVTVDHRHHHDGSSDAALQVVQLDGLADRAAQIPTNLTTTRSDLEQRLVLRIPRLLCVNKQYPRGCGVASLTSVYNYLYSWLGESEVGAQRAPHSQEEIMSILGFEPPFGDIAWGPFTGNATLIRWFHALNRHFGHKGRAYILYKAHGTGRTTHLYPDSAAALVAVKAALRDPHCALIYHCHNHYMVPVGFQEIPHAQVDFLKPSVPASSCDTTIFIGEVSRGRHEAVYARKWEHIVKDLECKSPFFFNIRHPEQGVQRREPKKKKNSAKAAAATNADAVHEPRSAAQLHAVRLRAADASATSTSPPPMLFIPIPPSLRNGECSAAVQPTTTSTTRTAVARVAVVDSDNEVVVGLARAEGEDSSDTPVVACAEAEGVYAGQGPKEDEMQARTTERASSATSADRVIVEPTFLPSSSPCPNENVDAECGNALDATLDDAGTEAATAEAAMSAAPAATVEAAIATADTAANVGQDAELADLPASLANNAVDIHATAASPLTATTDESLSLSLSPPTPHAEPQPSPNTVAVTAAETATQAIKTQTTLPLPLVIDQPVSPLLAAKAPLRAGVHAAPLKKSAKTQQSSTQVTTSPTKPKKERGNLHCLIMFRNDEVEERLDRYEDAVVEPAAGPAAATATSSSASSSEGSSSSDEDDG